MTLWIKFLSRSSIFDANQIFLVNYLDSGNKLFKIFINFCPLSKENPPHESSPKNRSMLRIFDDTGSPVPPLCCGLAPLWVIPLGRSWKSVHCWKTSLAQDQKPRKISVFAERGDRRPSDMHRQSKRVRTVPLPFSSPL